MNRYTAFFPPRILPGACALVAALTACTFITRNAAIGEAPLEAGIWHIILLASACVLIRYSPFPSRHTAMYILLIAAAARFILVPMDISGDVYRYVWEGIIQQHGHNPYVSAPDDELLLPLHTEWWQLMNHPEKTAIYPPGMMLLFRGFTVLTENPDHFKWLFIFFDLASLAVLLSILRTAGRHIEWAWLYAINPVVLLSFAGEAHLDSIMIFFALLSVRLYQGGWWRSMFALAALAFQAKYMALIIVPFILRRDNLRYLHIFAIIAVIPFFYYRPILETFSTLWMFGTEMSFHGSIHYLLTMLLGDMSIASLVSFVALAAFILALRTAVHSPLESLPYAWGCLIALSPTVHFWYLTWLIPFLCILPVRGWILLCGTITFSYATIAHAKDTGEWIEFPWAVAAIYVPVYFLFINDLLRRRQVQAVNNACVQQVRTIGVIVSTLNESAYLSHLLDDLDRQTKSPSDVIICDGGSTDATYNITRDHGAKFLRTDKGRGIQIASGIEHLAADAVFIAHADMRIPPKTLERIVYALNRSGKCGGAVGSSFDNCTVFLYCIEFMNYIRARWLGISFGDQGQFIRMDHLQEIGGFPAIPLMEDVELSARLKAVERPLYLNGEIIVSSRRWQTRNPWKHAVLVIQLTRRFLLYRLWHGHAPETAAFYKKYHTT